MPELYFKVKMNRRDVTKWVSALEVRQRPWTYFREFTISFVGWHSIEHGASWDIWGGYDSAEDELLIRQGMVPLDRLPSVTVDGKNVPTITVTGYDWAYYATRMTPRQTIILGASNSEMFATCRAQGRPLSACIFRQADRMHTAVASLGRLAGIECEFAMPDYYLGGHVREFPMELGTSPLIVEPTTTLWDAMWRLASVFRPEVFARRSRNTIVFGSRVAPETGRGARLISGSAIKSLTATKVLGRALKTVVVRIPI
ncbi:MAG: hypothetical protein V2A73_13935 [Pseudomonadota bacterium]